MLSKDKFYLMVILGACAVLCAVFFQPYYPRFISDGISYMSIARKYASGDFSGAVNGYWSPLFSFLIAPLAAAGVPLLPATKGLLVLFAFLYVWGVRLIALRFGMTETQRFMVVLAFAPLAVMANFAYMNPDALTAFLLAVYFFLVTDKRYLNGSRQTVLISLAAFAAYLSKYYVFNFFVLHFTLQNALYFFRYPISRKTVVRQYCLGMTVFFLLSAFWMAALYAKYGLFRPSMTGDYAFRLIGPSSQGEVNHFAGLLEPPDRTAVSAWEDPTRYVDRLQKWNPFASKENFDHYLSRLWQNFKDIHGVFSFYSSLFWVAIAFVLFGAASELRTRGPDAGEGRCLDAALFVVAYTAGYLLLIVQMRYLWIVPIMVIPAAVYAAGRLPFIRAKRAGALVALVLSLSVAYHPLREMATFSWQKTGSYADARRIEESVFDLAAALQQRIDLRGRRIASDVNWEYFNALAFLTGARYLGTPEASAQPGSIATRLLQHDVEIFFVQAALDVTLLAPNYTLAGETGGMKILARCR